MGACSVGCRQKAQDHSEVPVMCPVQMTGVVELEGKKLPAPTISGQFDTKLVATMADGSTKTLWEKRYPPGGLGR